ncbi:YfgM family protein [Thiosulfativibrio zosterae]|uniref:Ancillary SecYEG translocon subunit n=1 Tax=Thiosulfativibrio zosterae TaxID=2675053 RepID=A0A6F8PLN6_9GAMM|nr:tetratricopeptide repeat protein [Thiosulfativibrio zosterae]BBP42974.1 membrane protein [Thiosulfativibrio zosterae]
MSRYESDDEQVQALKDWWKANGTSLLSGLLAISIAWAGWNYWQNQTLSKAVMASSTFEVLQIKMEQGQFGDVARDGLKLMEEQPDSPYATGTALLLAKFYADKQEMDKAVEQLDWVMANAPDSSLKLISRLRLAQLQQQAGNLDEAKNALTQAKTLKLSTAEQANLDYALAELFLAQKDLDQARTHLKAVLDNQETSTNLATLARLQLDDIAQ